MGLSVDDNVNLVAIYAAVVSTVSILWQVWVWFRNGPRLHVAASADMQVMGGYNKDDKKYAVVNVANIGTAKTTITNVVVFTYKNTIHRLLNKPSNTFVVNHDVAGYQIPYVIESGCTFMSMVMQNDDMEALSRSSVLYMGVIHSLSARPVLARVRPIQPKQETD
jgi:hypothetical protein